MAMSQDQANTWIVTALAVSGTLVIVRDASDKKVPPVRLAIGLTVAGVLLGTLAQASPQLAGGFAIVLLLTSSLIYGGKAWKTLGDLLP
ncbi:hypothetical protein [Streptomyces sp. ISL-100]|uniref:hypothetical protein n=1 Tax=Streptomyces sp. ISL-100 TaxID=2819173 RepID=UPI001BEA3CC6|nr:hypothetical protein [Streptomyces sp. ISL-100]MBT2400638.1 hypothetical protein [Streptomyces sp. ISL-100]